MDEAIDDIINMTSCIVVIRKSAYSQSSVMDARFEVYNLGKNEGVRAIQTVTTTRGVHSELNVDGAPGLQLGTDTYEENGITYDNFVDGGIWSPWVQLQCLPPNDLERPYYIDVPTYNNCNATFEIWDNATAVTNHAAANFEDILVITNFNNSGFDLPVADYSWGTYAYGRGGQRDIPLNNSITPQAMQIIHHDYPNYQFYP